MARTDNIGAQLVAVAWVRGSITNLAVHAITGLSVNACGARIQYLVGKGHLEKVPKCGYPGSWRLTTDRAKAIASMPDQVHLRAQAEQVAQRMDRVLAIRAADKPQRVARQRAALGSPVASPPPKPGHQLVAPEPAGMPPLVAIEIDIDRGWTRAARLAEPAQAPKALPHPSAEALAAADPFRLRGGLLAPADGPYIRPGALAAQAVPSRRADGLVPHRPPLSQP